MAGAQGNTDREFKTAQPVPLMVALID